MYKVLIRGFVLLVFAVSFVTNVRAQYSVLGIEEMFRLAEENSRSARICDLLVREAEEALKTAEKSRYPSVEASLSAGYLGNGWMSDRDFSSGKNIPMPHFSNNFSLKVTQVLYAGGAIDRVIELKGHEAEMSRLEYDMNMQNLRFMLLGHYLDLYKAYNAGLVYGKNIENAELMLDDIRASYKAGTALKSDITRYEVRLNTLRLGLLNTENTVKVLSSDISTLLCLDTAMLIMPDTTLASRTVIPETENYWQELKYNSPALKAAETGVNIGKTSEKMEKSALLPQLAIVAGDNLDGPIVIEVPAINSNFNYWYAGVGIKYNFDVLFKNNRRVRQARLALQRAEEQMMETEEKLYDDIHSAYIRLKEAFEKIKVTEKSLELAEENYREVSVRYLNGLSLITDLLDADNLRLDSELDLVNARIDMLYQYYLLEKITGNL